MGKLCLDAWVAGARGQKVALGAESSRASRQVQNLAAPSPARGAARSPSFLPPPPPARRRLWGRPPGAAPSGVPVPVPSPVPSLVPVLSRPRRSPLLPGGGARAARGLVCPLGLGKARSSQPPLAALSAKIGKSCPKTRREPGGQPARCEHMSQWGRAFGWGWLLPLRGGFRLHKWLPANRVRLGAPRTCGKPMHCGQSGPEKSLNTQTLPI